MTEAGWYAAPDAHGIERWWDGTRWTDHTRPDPSYTPPASVPWRAIPGGMQFVVGVNERHEVTFTFDKMWGKTQLLVDGQIMVSEAPQFSASTTREWNVVVGVTEQHAVRIVKTRALFFAGFQPQLIQAFVDGQLVGQYQG